MNSESDDRRGAVDDPSAALLNAADDGVDDPRVLAALQRYMDALDAGQAPERHEFLAAHPDIATTLATCLESLALVHSVAPRLRKQVSDSVGLDTTAALPAALGDFRVIREIGRGGMGVVYEAEQLSLGRRVALKVLPFASALDATRLQRFKNEAQAAAQLHHTNIVPVYAVGCERGVHFYAMQLIEGQTLGAIVRQMAHSAAIRQGQSRNTSPVTEDWVVLASPEGEARRAAMQEKSAATRAAPQADTNATPPATDFTNLLSAERKNARAAFYQAAARLGVQAAEALEHAHQAGVIHRDVKPGNLLVDARGKLWITDFGLAQFQTDGGLTLTGNLPGTIRYMSPEQASGKRYLLDHRTDIYSLGVTLYELVTLEPAFDDSDGRVLVRHIAFEEPRAPRAIDRHIPQDLETILLKAMAKTPNDRYPTAQALADDLQRFLDSQPIRARRPNPIDRLVKWGRRHKPLVAAGMLLVVVCALGFLASTIVVAREHQKTKVAYQRAVEERAAAERNFLQARQAVDTFTQLGEEELVHKPSMYQLRRKFLETALDYYESFLEQHNGDSAVQAELAAARQRVARIVDELSVLSSFGPLLLLSDQRVQEDLAVTPQQRQRIEALIEQLWDEQAESVTEEQLTPEARQHQLAELLRWHEEQIAGVVHEEQMERLRQIAIQQQGPFAFKRPEVIETLDLSLDQRRRIMEIIDEHAPHHRPGDHHDHPRPGGGPGDWSRPPPPHEHGPGEHRAGRNRHDAEDKELALDEGRLPTGVTDLAESEILESASAVSGDSGAVDVAEGEPSRRDAPEKTRRGRRPPPPPPHERDFGGPHHGPFGSHGGPPPRTGQMRVTMRQTVDDILNVLSPTQRAAWQGLVGESIEFDLPLSPDEGFLW